VADLPIGGRCSRGPIVFGSQLLSTCFAEGSWAWFWGRDRRCCSRTTRPDHLGDRGQRPRGFPSRTKTSCWPRWTTLLQIRLWSQPGSARLERHGHWQFGDRSWPASRAQQPSSNRRVVKGQDEVLSDGLVSSL